MSENAPVPPKPEAPTGIAAIDALFQPVNRSDAPGLVVGMARDGKPLYRRGFGLASVELGVANTPWTRMRIGSTSKHFSCLAALLLAEEGLLDLDVGVRRYLPELPALAAEPTLRQFMSHTSGYRDYLDLGFLADGTAIKPKGVALPLQVRQGAVNFAPGERMMYNNGGYHLLSIVIERVSGMPFEHFLKERIFDPVGMVDTLSVPSDFEIHRGMATMHVALPEGGWRRGIFPTEEVRGEGAMISTVDDMLRWLAHLRAPRLVGSASTWNQLTTRARLNNGLEIPYALGLMRHAYRGVEVIHHAGGVIGGSCQMITVPAHALDIVIITNGGLINPVETGYRMIDAMLGDALTAPPETHAASERFKALPGKRYRAPGSGHVVAFADLGGKLGLSALNNPPVPLRDDGASLRMALEDIAAGPMVLGTESLLGVPGAEAPASIRIVDAGHAETFERLPEAPPLAEAGAALVGRYRCDDLDAGARIAFEGDALKLRITGAYGTSAMTLEAFTAGSFGWAVDGAHLPLRGMLSAERGAAGVDAFRIDTLRTRQLRFERVG